MTVTPLTLKQDSKEFVTALVQEKTGADISAATYEVAHILDADKANDPSTYPWETPHAESGPGSSTAYYQVKKLVTAALVNGAKTKYRVFVRITDNPEIPILDCGTYSVTP